MKQNNYTELLGESFLEVYYKKQEMTKQHEIQIIGNPSNTKN